jgi:hypothetical protein
LRTTGEELQNNDIAARRDRDYNAFDGSRRCSANNVDLPVRAADNDVDDRDHPERRCTDELYDATQRIGIVAMPNVDVHPSRHQRLPWRRH